MKAMQKLLAANVVFATAVLILLVNEEARSQPLEEGSYLFVETAGTQNAHVISLPDHQVIRTFDVEPEVYDILGSKDGKRLYINHGVGERSGRRFPESSEIVARDLQTLEILWRLDIPDGWAHHSVVSPDDSFLYVPIFDRPYILVVDLAKGEVVDRLYGDHGSHTSGLSDDGERLYIGSIFTETFAVYDLQSGGEPRRIQLDEGVRNFAVPSDESVAYVQLSGLHGFVIVDLGLGEPLRANLRKVHHPDPGQDLPTWSMGWPYKVDNGVAMSPDEKHVVFAASAYDKVLVYSHPQVDLVAEIETGKNPSWVLISDDSRYAYVTCQTSDEVAVISLETMEEVTRIGLPGEMPARMNIVDVAGR